MKVRWTFSVVLVVALTILLGVGTALADPTTASAPGTATSTNSVTLSVSVGQRIGINVPAGVTVNFTIDPAVAATVTSTDTVAIGIFHNVNANNWTLRAANAVDFTGTGLSVSRIETYTSGGGGYSVAAGTYLAGVGTATLTSGSGNLGGWRTATHNYAYHSTGTEGAAAGTYTATIVYSATSAP